MAIIQRDSLARIAAGWLAEGRYDDARRAAAEYLNATTREEESWEAYHALLSEAIRLA